MKKQFLMALAALSLLGGRTTAQEPACKPPLMGWSSWNAYRVNISEDIIKHQADLMVEKGLKDAGYRFINIDDGFFGYRDETGKMHEHAQRFPERYESRRGSYPQSGVEGRYLYGCRE